MENDKHKAEIMMIKILNSPYVCATIILLIFAIHLPIEANATLDKEQNTVFDIKAYEQLKLNKQNVGLSTFEIQKTNGVVARFSENKIEYSELLITRNAYVTKKLYYKPSGRLKYEGASFQGISVNESTEYGENGNLIRRVVHTAPDWVDKLVSIAKNKFNVDLWDPFNALILNGRYQGRDIVQIIHLKGEKIDLRGGDPLRYFAFLDFSTLEVITAGEIHSIPYSNNINVSRQVYKAEGKEIFLDE